MTKEAEPQAQETESAPAGDDRDSILAGMAELQTQPLGEGEVDLTQTSEPDEAAKAEVADEEPEETEEPEEEEDGTPDEEPEEPDLKLDADLEKIQQAEKRSKERVSEHIASERAELAKERAEFAALLEEAKEIKADHVAKERRTFDAKGKSHEELMAEARRLHALAVANNPDAEPAQKAQAQRTVKEQQMEERLAAAERRADEFHQRWEAREREVATREQARQVTDHLVSAVSDDTPLTRNILNGKGAPAAKERLLSISVALFEQTGEMPDASDVLKYFEEAERGKLAELGLDPDVVLKASKKTKKKTPVAGEKNSAPTLGNDLTTSTQPRNRQMTEAEEREDILKGMSQL